MAEHFVRPVKLFELGVSGLRNSEGKIASGYYLRWTQTYENDPAVNTAVGLCSDPEGNFLHPNPVQLGPRGDIVAYGLGVFKLELFASLTDVADDTVDFTFNVQLGVIADS